MGFVNPTLYANPSAFYDITSGSNPGCESNGFAAVSGWVSFYTPIITWEQVRLTFSLLQDPVTGLGTPNYEALLQVSTDDGLHC